jgi:hypothetical protein
MADTIREQVLAAFFTVINTAVPVAIPGTGVERNRSRPIPIDSDSFVILFDGPQLITSDETCNTRYTLDVEAEGYARAATDLLLGPAVNQLYGQLVKAALSDHSLGGLAIDVREGNMQDIYIDDEASKPTGAFPITFSIQFSTVGGDPFTIGV